jgi:hypothetical protein
MSRNVLKGRGPHTYFDDLESFFYVLCWILVAFEGPGLGIAALPPALSQWDGPASYLTKQGILSDDFELSISPWFGKSLRELAIRLHRFFEFRGTHSGRPLASLNPAEDYDEFLDHIRQGIADLAAEPEPAVQSASDISGNNAAAQRGSTTSASRQTDHGDDCDGESPRPGRRRRRVLRMRVAPPPSVARSRRVTANYDGPIGD